jgi:hypothetical protein
MGRLGFKVEIRSGREGLLQKGQKTGRSCGKYRLLGAKKGLG